MCPPSDALQMWGGVECTVNRVHDSCLTQLDRSGHDDRDDDLERFASLGIRTIRYPVLWERTAPDGIAQADWRFADRRLPALRRLGITPVVGLVHHGSGPKHVDLLNPAFADGLAEFAKAVAERFPWVDDWTPVNEPLTTARFSCLYGVWYPHARDDRSFVAAVLNQCRATVLAMQAIRTVNPRARLVQTDDLGQTHGTARMAETVAFYNARRWLCWDLLCGHVVETHPLRSYLVDNGASTEQLAWFIENACPPDLLGINYYVNGDRWLDHRVDAYPARPAGELAVDAFVDVEAVRAEVAPDGGIAPLIDAAWQRYGIPIVVTEAHIDARREDQLRWLVEIWQGAEAARQRGADVRAVTAWSLLGAFDWNSLLSDARGYYEPGPFDVRSPTPRRTALATLIVELAGGHTPGHPVLTGGTGWWRRPDRFTGSTTRQLAGAPHRPMRSPTQQQVSASPILISGATGTLGRAFAIVCAERDIAFKLLSRADMDIADDRSVDAALRRWNPWAVINASGYVRIDDAESDVDRCFRENATGPTVLAARCASAGVGLLTFSSDQVFDGETTRPWVESDTPAPLNCYGRSKLAAERAVLSAWPQAMVVRTSAFFSPWDRHNFVVHALDTIESGRLFQAAADVRVSPTYLPDLVNVSLDLLIDRESGIWHLANVGDVSWSELAGLACDLAGADRRMVIATAGRSGTIARRPRDGVLGSERAALMPALAGALAHFVQCRADAAALAQARAAAVDHPRRPEVSAAIASFS